jgi:anti-sigma factor RsiW
MKRPLCAAVALLPSGWRILARHQASCLACQAAAARGRALQRSLASLAEPLPAPPGLHAGVVARLGVQDSADPRRALVARAVARYTAVAGVAAGMLAVLLGGLVRRRARAMG